MLRRLFNMEVPPKALLLPRRPDLGRCRLCGLDNLEALIDVLLERCNNDLSQHKEVRRHCQLQVVAGALLSTTT